MSLQCQNFFCLRTWLLSIAFFRISNFRIELKVSDNCVSFLRLYTWPTYYLLWFFWALRSGFGHFVRKFSGFNRRCFELHRWLAVWSKASRPAHFCRQITLASRQFTLDQMLFFYFQVKLFDHFSKKTPNNKIFTSQRL